MGDRHLTSLPDVFHYYLGRIIDQSDLSNFHDLPFLHFTLIYSSIANLFHSANGTVSSCLLISLLYTHFLKKKKKKKKIFGYRTLARNFTQPLPLSFSLFVCVWRGGRGGGAKALPNYHNFINIWIQHLYQTTDPALNLQLPGKTCLVMPCTKHTSVWEEIKDRMKNGYEYLLTPFPFSEF